MAAEGQLLGLVDDPYPAPANLADDPVVAELLQRRHAPRGGRPRPAGLLRIWARGRGPRPSRGRPRGSPRPAPDTAPRTLRSWDAPPSACAEEFVGEHLDRVPVGRGRVHGSGLQGGL